jgi:hypothetical protein
VLHLVVLQEQLQGEQITELIYGQCYTWWFYGNIFRENKCSSQTAKWRHFPLSQDIRFTTYPTRSSQHCAFYAFRNSDELKASLNLTRYFRILIIITFPSTSRPTKLSLFPLLITVTTIIFTHRVQPDVTLPYFTSPVFRTKCPTPRSAVSHSVFLSISLNQSLISEYLSFSKSFWINLFGSLLFGRCEGSGLWGQLNVSL